MDNPYLNTVTRIMFMRVPIDIIPSEELENLILDLATRGQLFKIVLLTYRDFVRARRDPEYLGFLKDAALVVPVSKSLERGCKFLKHPTPVRFHSFDLVIRILGVLEQRRKSYYLLGGTHREVQKLADNLRTSFPTLKNVGRHDGNFPKEHEESILLAIQKATPTFLFLGSGVPGKDKWVFRNRNNLAVNITLWSAEAFDIMAGRRRRPNRESFQKGTHEFARALIRPHRWIRALSYAWYAILLLFYRIAK